MHGAISIAHLAAITRNGNGRRLENQCLQSIHVTCTVCDAYGNHTVLDNKLVESETLPAVGYFPLLWRHRPKLLTSPLTMCLLRELKWFRH